jgi:hypothetical protein
MRGNLCILAVQNYTVHNMGSFDVRNYIRQDVHFDRVELIYGLLYILVGKTVFSYLFMFLTWCGFDQLMPYGLAKANWWSVLYGQGIQTTSKSKIFIKQTKHHLASISKRTKQSLAARLVCHRRCQDQEDPKLTIGLQ